MTATKATYKVTATVVKVAVGPVDGNRVARFVDRGDIIPDGVDQGILDQLVKLGRIEKVRAEAPSESDVGKSAAAKAAADAKAAAEAKSAADAKVAADAKAAADAQAAAEAKSAADAKSTAGKTTAAK